MMPLSPQPTVDGIVDAIVQWAKTQSTTHAVALVGSHARRTARFDSDIDIVVLTTEPSAYRNGKEWLNAIDWASVGAHPADSRDEDYGALWSRRVWLDRNAGEIELSFAAPSWADRNPVDAGTHRVVADGMHILHDPEGILASLKLAVEAEQRKTQLWPT